VRLLLERRRGPVPRRSARITCHVVFSDGAAGYKLKQGQPLPGFKGVAAVRPVAGEPG